MNRLVLAVLLLTAFPLFGQVERFRFPVRAQLPYAIVFGSQGLMWVSSGDLAALFRVNPDLTITSLAGGVSGRVAEDAAGGVWGAGFFEVFRFDQQTGARTQEVALRGAEVFAGPDGNLWVPRRDAAEVVKLSPAGVILATYARPGGTYRDGLFGADGAFWLVTGGKNPLLVRMTTTGSTTSFPLPFPGRLRETGEGFWLVSNEVAARIDRGGDVLAAWSLPRIEGADYDAVAADASGNLWLGTVSTLSRLTANGTLTDFFWPPAPPNPCGRAFKSGMAFASDGTLWVVEMHNPPSPISPPGDPCSPPVADDYLTRVTVPALNALRERPLPAHGEAHIPALDFVGFLVLSTLLCFLGAFRLFGR